MAWRGVQGGTEFSLVPTICKKIKHEIVIFHMNFLLIKRLGIKSTYDTGILAFGL